MKALLLVHFNTIYAQCCGDKLLRWKEKASNTAAANNSLIGGKHLKIDWAK
jgi:hypothetical protein